MRYHTRHEAEPDEQIRRARVISRAIVDAVPETVPLHREFLRTERDRLAELDPHVLYHDDLAADNEALYLHELVERASQHGLRYLADADFSSMHPHGYPLAAHAVLAQCGDRV